MQITQLPGTYNIKGINQNEESSTYKGTLTLSLDENLRVNAEWLINNSQIQFGNGFFKNNILVINFNYVGDNDAVFKGVVVYKCISQDILEGFWSEKHGNPQYLGEETCFRIGTQNEVIN
ncbi:hypothetical protein [Psychroserpens damuponensis]|uniref:hypothetical protein n=1 Tax=Psychroserpens damuponensis TaxID=943936 RepID=UPI00058C664B|nr:hypothetical protein [Psychroserpens damuponensis]